MSRFRNSPRRPGDFSTAAMMLLALYAAADLLSKFLA